MERMVSVQDLKRGDVVKINEQSTNRLGTDQRVTVEVTRTHTFEGGSKQHVYVEFRSGLDLRLT